MDQEYVVLRTRGLRGAVLNSGRPDPFWADPAPPVGAAAGADEAEAGLTVETATLTEKQAEAEARDPENLLAPNIPVALIKPLDAEAFGATEVDALAAAKAAQISWGVADVKAQGSSYTGKGVKVAVLDTGIDQNHEAFKGVNIVGRNFTSSVSNDFGDRQGHGTHCAGTIFGRPVDGIRIGVAPGVTDVLIGKVLDDSGSGSSAMVLDALQWAAQQKVNVVSMSLGFDFPGMQDRLSRIEGRPAKLATSMALRAYRENLRLFDSLLQFLMLENVQGRGMVVVAASGNESRRQDNENFTIDVSLPAAANAIVSVGAFDRNLKVAPFSNINPVVSAPGVEIVSARPNGGLVALNGTSMACPHVAGVAALWWEESASQGYVNGAMVRSKLLASASMAHPKLPLTPVDGGAGRPTAPP